MYRTMTLSMALFGAVGTAQDEDVLVQRRQEKLASEFLKRADWIHDYDQARAIAKESGRPIFAYFSRSYTP